MTGLREKYLASLEEQERMEKQFALQSEYMRKTLVHLAAAADGLDEHLDASLVLLKEKMRGGSGSEVVNQMELVQKAVIAFERNRDLENAEALQNFSLIVSQLLELKLPKTTRVKLEAYTKGLKHRLGSWRVYPSLANELAALQKAALDAALNPPQSLWQRVKGGKTLNGDVERDQPRGLPREVKTDSAEFVRDIRKGTANIESPEAEDGYAKMAQRINATLRSLVDNIEPNEIISNKLAIVHSRLNRGMDWYALIITLEDIRDILMHQYVTSDEEFSDYLEKINLDLANIREKLGLATNSEAGTQDANQNLNEAVSRHVNEMKDSIKGSQNLDHLKEKVTIHIDDIQEALNHYEKNTQSYDNEQISLTEQLKSLVEKVQNIESESETTRQELEEERYKATHDNLTKLPNREAYGRRAWEEMQRFKRYARPLSIAVCDIDHFKRFNDDYGHQAGDKVLVLVASLLSKRLRTVDFIARYGGEEFVILLPETTKDQTLAVLEKIRSAVAKASFRFRDDPVQITVSFGIAQFDESEEVESAFARADKALYAAKEQGRNCVVVAESVDEQNQKQA